MENSQYKSIPLDGQKLAELVSRSRATKVTYGLGSKAPSLSSQPGRDFKAIDCSGFLRLAVYQASPQGARVIMPDGSFYQNEWAQKQGFKVSTPDACLLKDGRVRMAYWRNKKKNGVSHISLVLNGRTVESHGGGVGPDRRTWSLKTDWMAESTVYVLDMGTDDLSV